MKNSATDPVSSGLPYEVLATDGEDPATLGQFVGPTRFTIDKDGSESQISGIGVAEGTGVRFHEKDAEHGKDVRVWQITKSPSGGFSAASTTSF